MEQQIILNGYQNIEQILQDEHVKRCFIVHGHSFEKKQEFTQLQEIAGKQGIQLNSFCEYTSNPKVEEVQAGVELFQQHNCDFIVAVGGGSAIDVAKCIKKKINCGRQKEDTGYVKMLAIPTTAGTGSESTQFAVVYENGEKKSVDDADILPDYVILDADLLRGLPLYQRKATMLDALCQAIESIWAKRATSESRKLAAEAIRIIMDCYQGYIRDIPEDNERMLKAANLAGQAINITRTTAAHAMSYKITSLYGAAHGHAVAICLSQVWGSMLCWLQDRKVLFEEEQRHKIYAAFQLIAQSMECTDNEKALKCFEELLEEMCFDKILLKDEKQLKVLVSSVNVQRMSNHPMCLTQEQLGSLYKQILR